MRDAKNWPGIAQALIAEVGTSKVWQAGLEALGYPPNWVRDSKEMKRIREKLEDPNYVPF